MAIDTRFSLPSLLARRRQSLSDWLKEQKITSYKALCDKLDSLGGQPLDRKVYNEACKVKKTVEQVVTPEPLVAKEPAQKTAKKTRKRKFSYSPSKDNEPK